MNGNRYFKWLSGIENFKAIEAAPQIMTHRILVSLRCKKVENGREAVALCNNDVAGISPFCISKWMDAPAGALPRT